ncbi:hypothetical protein [Bradyrhizobium australafricanum]|uniref:hypothetical protein n=1 Tax=Bradyrhizobium australafricanum TaxID=2821406 RepID=UPI001CE2434B|nr:hypothetical protein [Bradyrhizobium australafricanum]MCA6101957.1 hypothetical protein [Bradyrhizobium australafricanum]
MDAFEQVVAEILWIEGYWVRTSVRVELTKEEKKKIGRPSSPRWELDIVAYNSRDNLLQVVECKSYLDSPGVQAIDFHLDSKTASRYKLFNDATLRETVFSRLTHQLSSSGLCRPNPKVELCLACGKINDRSRSAVRARFEAEGWHLWDENWLKSRLRLMSKMGYENQVSAVVSKLLLRGALSEQLPSELASPAEDRI